MGTQGGRAGSTLDSFLAEEGIREEATAHAIKSLMAWQDRPGDEGAVADEGGDGTADADEPGAGGQAARLGEQLGDAPQAASRDGDPC